MSASKPQEIYQIQPILNYRLWGSERLAKLLHTQEQGIYGEAFLLSALPDAESIVDELPLSVFYQQHRDFFGWSCKEFPLRVNLIDAQADLSVQSHPNQMQAKTYGYTHEVNEGWYILDCPLDAHIVLGHHAKTEQEFVTQASLGQYDSLLHQEIVMQNQFFYLPAGTVHAIKAGMLVYEITCNIDITYRLYDYDRIDPRTQTKRPLQQEEVIASLRYGDLEQPTPVTEKLDNLTITTYIDQPNVFTLKRISVCNHASFAFGCCTFLTIIKGEGTMNGQFVHSFDSYLLSQNLQSCTFTGNLELLAVQYKEKEGTAV